MDVAARFSFGVACVIKNGLKKMMVLNLDKIS